ncbi:unnamed protein product [Lactuca saligna]|uniref:Replication factor A C-terminal domain-containing protein n=1 Tax=Lactuca saligna TaxID=75948 RepID=A0AA35VFB8_LACSI|nr:unnamed protein product [Lactuca saligna]
MYWIADVKPNEEPIPLRIRVIKKWKTRTTEQDLCYLFVDRHGDAIEAVADPRKEQSLDAKMTVNLCYTVTGYVALPARKSRRVVQHDASVRLGDTSLFEPLCDLDIPSYFYDFATYDILLARKLNPKQLSDYIGRAETISPPLIRKAKRIKKVKIQDQWANIMEITFWDESIFPYQKEEAVGKVLAVTATLVTEYQNNLQLETTEATSAFLNPQIPNLQSITDRFNQLKHPTDVQQNQQTMSIHQIVNKFKEDPMHNKFTYTANVTEITLHRKWYYVTCPRCPKKLFLQKGIIPRFVCEDDGYVPEPIFMYCVNTTIADESTNAKAIFFNDAMTQMLEKSCHDMVITHGHSDPDIIPSEILDIRGKTMVFDVAMKKDGTMAINKAIPQTALEPVTPNPKAIVKRHPPSSQALDMPRKQKKC